MPAALFINSFCAVTSRRLRSNLALKVGNYNAQLEKDARAHKVDPKTRRRESSLRAETRRSVIRFSNKCLKPPVYYSHSDQCTKQVIRITICFAREELGITKSSSVLTARNETPPFTDEVSSSVLSLRLI